MCPPLPPPPPLQFMSLHGPYGSPDALRSFVDTAHGLGIGVIFDVV